MADLHASQPQDAGTTAPATTAVAPAHERFHHLDRLRAFLMLWGILLHASFLIRDQSAFHVQLLIFGRIWRMPAFFLIAAALSLMVIDRKGLSTWFSGRAVRVGVPLLLALLVINPFQLALSELRGLGGPYPLFPGLRFTVHAWFLAFLLVMCWMLLIVMSAAQERTNTVLRLVGRWTLRNSWTLALTSVVLGVVAHVLSRAHVALSLQQAFPPLGPGFPVFLLFFCFGLVVWRSEGGVRRFGELARGPVLVLAIATLPVTATRPLMVDLPAILGTPQADTLFIVRTATALAWTAILFRVFARWSKPSGPVARWLVDASLPVYLVHHVFKFVWQPYLATLTDFSTLNWLIAVAAMTIASFMVYELVNQFRVTRFAFTGTTRRGQGFIEVVKELRARPKDRTPATSVGREPTS